MSYKVVGCANQAAIVFALLAALGCSTTAEKAAKVEDKPGTAQQALNSVSYVSGTTWYVDGQPWLMKGVNYDPSEPCEYYTQYNWGRIPSDAPLMKSFGFNTIRTYGFTSAKTGLPENGYITTSQLDALYANGIRVILTVHSAPGDSTWTGIGKNGNNIIPATGDFTPEAKTRIQLLAAHPAVIALGIGNEIRYNFFYTADPGGAWSNGWSVPDVVNHANYVTSKARALTDKPITVSWGNTWDINQVGNLTSDIVSYQLYHQLLLDDIFNLSHANAPNKPFYISEFGADAYNAGVNGVDEASQAYADNNLFKQILDQATTGAGGNSTHRVVGGTVFSWSDGWWKAGNPCAHDIGGVAPGDGPYPDKTYNEEYWGLCTGGTESSRVCRQAAGTLKTLFAQYSSGGAPPPPTARDIANNLEAESNDGQNNVQFEGTTDTGGGQDAGWIDATSWIDWKINVATAGSYKITSRSASTAAASYAIKLDSNQVATANVPNTGGWQAWQNVDTNQFTATAGIHTLRIAMGSAGQNLNYIKMVPVTGNGGAALTGTIEAEAFSATGGCGTEACSEGGSDLMDIGNNEWTSYNNVAMTGVTSFQARVASANLPGTIEFHNGSTTGTLLATCSAPYTGGWQTWQTISCDLTSTVTGNINLYLVFKGTGNGSQQPNVNWFKPIIGGSGGSGGGTGAQPTRLRITNQCSEPIWIAHNEGTGGPIPDAQNIKIDPNTSHDYAIPSGRVEATRFMPRTGCDSSGLNCKIGQSVAPCPSGGCQPPVETKFEATWGTTTPSTTCPNAPSQNLGECVTWYNASFVDGYTLPVKVVPKQKQAYADCRELDASNLRLDNCPGSDNIGAGHTAENLRIVDPADSTRIIGCMSPCKKLNYSLPWGYNMPESQDPAAHMCCPTPYPNNTPLQCTWANGCGTSAMCNDMNDPNTVVHTNYVNSLQAMAPSVYSYAYDDADSLRTCMPDTQFEVIYCPGGSPSAGKTSGGTNPATCTDHIQNQGETGVDCGGPCASCATCSDGQKNGTETGIDCGGSCAACATCSDGVQNQGETGVDCGGPCSACATSGGVTYQGENYSATGGCGVEACSDTGGGNDLKDIGDGEWAAYQGVNLNGVTSFQMRTASAGLAGTIEVRTDNQNGTLLGTCSAPVTGGWQTWTTISCNATGASGVHDVYLVFHGGAQYNSLPNVNWWKTVTSGSCTPTTCSAAGKNCGSISNGCGGTLNCGSCTAPNTCGASVANVCGCVATTCANVGANCGSIDNGCGGTISCGSCTSPQTCGGGGTANVCGGGGGGGSTCWAAFSAANWPYFTTGTQVSSNHVNYTCNSPNCQNAGSNSSCYPGASGCPWGTVWTNNGACN